MGRISQATLIISAALIFCVLSAFFITRAQPFNSDLVQNFNELFAVLHGNPSLYHWALAEDNFYFTDLPFFILLSLIFGPQSWLIYTEPTIIFGLLLLASVLIVVRARPSGAPIWGGALVLLYLIGLPFGSYLFFLLAPADHIATIFFCLWAVLMIQPMFSGDHVGRWRLFVLLLLVFAATASDPLAQVLFVLPLLIFNLISLWLNPKFRPYDWMMSCVVLAASVLGYFWPQITLAHHGFLTEYTYSKAFVPDPAALFSNIHALISGLRILLIAQDRVSSHLFLHPVLSATRCTAMSAVFVLCIRVLWRMPRAPEQRTAQFLVVASLGYALASVFSAAFSDASTTGVGYPHSAIRFITPIYIFTAIAAAMEVQNVWTIWAPPVQRAAIASFGIFAVLFLIADIFLVMPLVGRPPGLVETSQYRIGIWLEAHQLTYGVGDYWSAPATTAFSGHRVIVDQVTIWHGTLVPFVWLTDLSNFLIRRQPQFVLYVPGNIAGISPQSIEQSYGKPLSVYDVSGSQVWTYQR